MNNNKFLQNISGKIISIGLVVILLVPILVYIFLSMFKENIEFWNILVDISLKITASILGILWLLNRYFTTRQDSKKLRIEGTAFAIKSGEDRKILNYNMSINNDSNVLIKNLKYSLEIGQYEASLDDLTLNKIYSFPSEKNFVSSNIEPNSWIGIDENLLIDSSIELINIRIKFEIDNQDNWTWHKTFKI